jgi:multiple sugar transport system substrate-binding protein
MKKEITAAALAVALVGSLAACSTSSSPTEASATEELSGTVSMLTPLFSGDADKVALTSSLAKFTADHPKVDVKVDYTSYGKLNEKVSTALASGLLPDVLQIGFGWIPPLASKNVLAPLDDLGFSKESLAADFPAAAVQNAQFDGHVYGVPLVVGGVQGVYRKDLFTEAGLDPSKPPTTWDELRTDAIALTQRDSSGTLQRAGFTVLTDNLRQNFAALLIANGGRLFSEDTAKAQFNAEEGVAALSFMDQLVNEDKVVDVGFESGAPQHPILNGKAAMALAGANIPCDNPTIVDPDICKQFGYFAVPGSEKGKSGNFLGGTFSTVTQASKNPKAAAALVKFLSADAGATFAAATSTSTIPASKTLWTDKRVTSNEATVAFLASIESAGTEGGTVNWLDIRNDFQPSLESTIVGGTPAKESLDQLAVKADSAQ